MKKRWKCADLKKYRVCLLSVSGEYCLTTDRQQLHSNWQRRIFIFAFCPMKPSIAKFFNESKTMFLKVLSNQTMCRWLFFIMKQCVPDCFTPWKTFFFDNSHTFFIGETQDFKESFSMICVLSRWKWFNKGWTPFIYLFVTSRAFSMARLCLFEMHLRSSMISRFLGSKSREVTLPQSYMKVEF